ncbi:MAG: hypothetical protein BroJett040_15590 [Oligoflexia bacterium]|nr:MAG: hypothetical protein BroJett040_15590 [Oligoflexia bacterium]
MRLEVATKADNEELLKFYSSFPLNGLIDLKVSRGSNFFAPYQTLADDFRTYVLKDPEKGNQIEATASFLIKDTIYNNKRIRIAHATDLRVSNSRKAIIEWTQHFLPVLQQIQSDFKTEYCFSHINLSDPTAFNTFVRPRTMKRPLPRYFLYRKYNLISLHGRYPFSPKPLEFVKIRPASEANVDALIHYLAYRSQFRPFTSVWDKESFLKKIHRLPGFKPEDFLVAFDSYENVVGCLAHWSPQEVHQYIPLSYSLRAHNFRQFLKFGWAMGWTRRLTKPYVSTGEESPLNYRVLMNIMANNEDIFESLLWHAYQAATPNQFLIYAQIEQDYRLAPPPTWIQASIPHALYCMLAPDSQTPDFLHPSHAQNPEIEATLI